MFVIHWTSYNFFLSSCSLLFRSSMEANNRRDNDLVPAESPGRDRVLGSPLYELTLPDNEVQIIRLT